MKAIWKDTVIAESDDTVVVEGEHYFPEASLKREYVTFSNHRSTCHWKGQAQYYSLMVDGELKADAVCYYPEPSEAAQEIAGRVAFGRGRSGGVMLGTAHRRRLREVYRSAGWPCQDLLEVELLDAGLLERRTATSGHETLRVTDAGIAAIAEALARNRARREAHEALVERIARDMTRAGRLAWRGLALRARVDDGWVMAMPDVFSIRHTTVEDYLEPVVHEVKVHRADLLSDLKRPAKRAAYLQLGGECWYVLREGIARADEIPPECGVIVAGEDGLEVVRPAPRRALRLPFAAWMALAKATPIEGWRDDESQHLLGHDAAAR